LYPIATHSFNQEKTHQHNMQKAKAIQVVGTNIDNLGSELEISCKETAANTEAEWHKTGKEAGLLIWRVENFKVVPVPPQTYGQFFEGDSYIILSTTGGPGHFKYELHFWLGNNTSIDEAGTAVYKTVELDTYLHRAAPQHREVQGHESDLFLSYFPNGLRILSGGIESGFHHVKPAEYKPRLLQVKGKANKVRFWEVPLQRDSLNSGDVFILDDGLTLYQWNGAKSNHFERLKATQLTHGIISERDGKPNVVILDESDQNEDFWKHLGGYGPVKSADEGGADDAAAPFVKKLYKLSDASGTLTFTEVASGTIHKSALNSDDVFIYDAGIEIFVWIGKGASPQEKAKGMGFAQDYIKEHNRPEHLPITRLHQGSENETWDLAFDN
jgi:gelsolin